eukprot:Opistho-2@55660
MPIVATMSLSLGAGAPPATVTIEEVQARIDALSVNDDNERTLQKAIRKEAKDLDQSLDACTSVESKFDTVYRQLVPLMAEHKRLERDLLQSKRQQEHVTKERDAAVADLARANAAKAKLEQLCRELQKQSKSIKDETKRLTDAEQTKRDELSAKFQKTIGEITERMDKDTEARHQQAKEHEELRGKFQSYMEQYDLREQYFEKVLKSKELEFKLSEAKLDQQARMTMQEQTTCKHLRDQNSILAKSESDLKSQLATYAERFEQFQETVKRSNELFGAFREEMDRMTKTTKKLEKDNASLKQTVDKANVTILEFVEEKERYKKSLELQTTKLSKLESLCRALQNERAQLKAELGKYQPSIAQPPALPQTDAAPDAAPQ